MRTIVTACFLVVLVGALNRPVLAQQRADFVIENGTIHDGTGGPAVQGHVAVKDGKILSVGAGPGPEAEWRIDATGLVMTPGFIDLHTHSDRGVTAPHSRSCVNYLMQGCTTSVTGNCGSGPTDVKEYYDKIDVAGAGTNVAHLLPQGALRGRVVGSTQREATPEELDEMRLLARKAMEEGAWGMSTGLIYTPSSYANTEELIEIAKEIAAAEGIYASHIRGEGSTLLAAVKEAIQIGQEAGCPTHVSHFKASGQPYWGTLRLAIELIEQARQAGARVTADQYPYTASSTSLEATVFPTWSRSGGNRQLVERLDEAETGVRIREEVSQALEIRDQGKALVIARYSTHPEWVGKNLKEIAEAEGKTPLEVAEEITRNGGASIVNFGISEDDVRQGMVNPWVATASDGGAQVPSADRPHPRSYGTFPRKIGHYAIREGVLPLEQAIRSSSGLPADILGMKDRGYLKPGLAADIVIFDPRTFIDTATFEQPHHYATGIRYVFVNGVPAVHEGIPTGALAGKALRKEK